MSDKETDEIAEINKVNKMSDEETDEISERIKINKMSGVPN